MKKQNTKRVRLNITIEYPVSNESSRELLCDDRIDISKAADLKKALKAEVENCKEVLERRLGDIAPYDNGNPKLKVTGEIL